MLTLNRFWRSLERLAGQAAVLTEWKLCLGPEWPYARDYLRPTGTRGRHVPRCSALRSTGRAYRPPYHVVDGGPETYRAVAPDGEESICVAAEDLAVYELHRSRLASRLAQTLGFHPGDADIDGLRDACRAGVFAPIAGRRIPVFLAFPGGAHDLRQCVTTIVSLHKTSFLLLTPTLQHCDEFVERVLTTNGGMLIPLCHTIVLGAEAEWCLTEIGRDNLEQFLARHAPRRRLPSAAEYFPTPPNATWSDVRIRFLDGETITLSVKDVSATLNYTQLGMADRRNGRPTVQWELLRIFAREQGVLDWSSRAADRRRQKQRDTLARQMRTFLRIDGDPFCAAGNGWQARFKLIPDA